MTQKDEVLREIKNDLYILKGKGSFKRIHENLNYVFYHYLKVVGPDQLPFHFTEISADFFALYQYLTTIESYEELFWKPLREEKLKKLDPPKE